MGSVVFYSTADLSVNNGQGVYSRKILEVLIKEAEGSGVRLKVILPKSNNRIACLDALPENDVYFLPQKIPRDRLYHFKAQVYLFIKLLFVRNLSAVIYSVKPMQIGLVALNIFRNFRNIVLLEGLASNSIETIGLRNVEKITGKFVLSYLIKKSVVVIAAYDRAAKWAQSLNAKNIRIIPCGIDKKFFYPCLNKMPAPGFMIGYVGSFRAVHKLDLLIESVAMLDVKVNLYGEGHEFNKIKKLVGKLGVEDKVKFFGDVPQESLRSAICECDLLWGYTDIEHWGVPIKVFEYLACNKPVLVSRRAEFQFIEDLEYGLVIQKEDVSVIVDSIKYYMKEKSSQIHSYEYIEKNYNWNKFGECLSYID